MGKEPVASAGALAGLLGAFLIWLRIMGWIDLSEDAYNQTMLLISLALPIATSVWARQRVTPSKDPIGENTNGDLVPLVPADGSQLKRD
jgi:hypothetical protein